jgi:hypothetical protein
MERPDVNEAITAIVVAVIGGPVMWLLYRLDKRNTEQHGQSMAIIQEVKNDVKDVKGDMIDVKADVRDLKSDVRRLDAAAKPKVVRTRKTA